MNERLKTIAEELMRIEKEAQTNPSELNFYFRKMEKIIAELTLEEMLEVDEYIQINF